MRLPIRHPILANEKRVVTGLGLHASSETEVFPEMLDQSERVSGTAVDRVMLDAGYFHNDVIDVALERDLDLLCPEGKVAGQPRDAVKFQKGQFRYNEVEDVYVCPAGEQLILLSTIKESDRSPGHRVYGGASCETCSLRQRCTTRREGRQIKRYACDDARDALREVMRQPGAQQAFCQRKAMVEPVFSHLRQVQGLNRFRRKGLQAVKREFGLHVLAYNLSRVVAWFRVFIWALLGVQRRYWSLLE